MRVLLSREQVYRREREEKVRHERRCPGVVFRYPLAEKQCDDIDAGNHGADVRHCAVVRHEQQCAPDSAQCSSRNLEDRDDSEHRPDCARQWALREMLVEVLAISPPIHDLVDARLKKHHCEKGGDQNLQDVKCNFG